MIGGLDFSNLGQTVLELAQRLIIVLIALTFHEVAHGWAAKKLGDNTADASGRLSLNPIHHLDLVEFLCMVFFRFGWAKPVPINVRNFKKPRRDMAISALAGPIANLLLAFIILLPYEVILALLNAGVLLPKTGFSVNLINVIIQFVFSFHYMNITLAIFNFIPVPPLDGSRVLWAVLPDKLYFGVMKYEQYLSLGIMVLLLLGWLDEPLMIASDYISFAMRWVWGLLPFFN